MLGGERGRLQVQVGPHLRMRVSKAIPPHTQSLNHVARVVFDAVCQYLEKDPKRLVLFQLGKVKIIFKEVE